MTNGTFKSGFLLQLLLMSFNGNTSDSPELKIEPVCFASQLTKKPEVGAADKLTSVPCQAWRQGSTPPFFPTGRSAVCLLLGFFCGGLGTCQHRSTLLRLSPDQVLHRNSKETLLMTDKRTWLSSSTQNEYF